MFMIFCTVYYNTNNNFHIVIGFVERQQYIKTGTEILNNQR